MAINKVSVFRPNIVSDSIGEVVWITAIQWRQIDCYEAASTQGEILGTTRVAENVGATRYLLLCCVYWSDTQPTWLMGRIVGPLCWPIMLGQLFSLSRWPIMSARHHVGQSWWASMLAHHVSACLSLYCTVDILLLPQLLTASWTVSGTTQVSQYEKGKTNLDLMEQEIVSGIGISKSASCPSQNNHASIPPLSFSQARRPSCHNQQCQSTDMYKNVVGYISVISNWLTLWQDVIMGKWLHWLEILLSSTYTTANGFAFQLLIRHVF